MDLDEARRALSKRGAFSSKRVAFFVAAGLCLAAGIVLHAGQYFSQPSEQNAPVAVAAPPPPAATSAIPQTPPPTAARSEERRVGKEWRRRADAHHSGRS